MSTPAAVDRRFSAGSPPKARQDGHGQVAFWAFRELVLGATRGWDGGKAVNRGRLAQYLGTSESVIDGYMSPGDVRMPPLVMFHRLMASEMVPPEVKARVGKRLLVEWGLISVNVMGQVLSLESVSERVQDGALGIAEAAGKLSGEVRAAAADGQVTEDERSRIRAVLEKASAAVAALEAMLGEKR